MEEGRGWMTSRLNKRTGVIELMLILFPRGRGVSYQLHPGTFGALCRWRKVGGASGISSSLSWGHVTVSLLPLCWGPRFGLNSVSC